MSLLGRALRTCILCSHVASPSIPRTWESTICSAALRPFRVGGKPVPFIAMFAKQNARRAPPFSLLRICASRLHLPDTWSPRARLATADFLLCCVRFGTGVHIATPASAPEANVRASAPVVHRAVFHRSAVTPTVPSNSAPIPTFPVQSRNNPTCFLLRIARATRCAHAHAAHRPNI